jgi:hypothetical protein
VHVAYYFVYKDLPSTEYAAVMSKILDVNLFRQNQFKGFRQRNSSMFQIQMMHRKNPFNALASYLYEKINLDLAKEA